MINKGKKMLLTDVELVVMQVIWSHKRNMQLQDILRLANEKTGKTWKPQTISTYLSRLVGKGFLRMLREERYNTYEVLIDRDTYMEWEMDAFTEKWGDQTLLDLAFAFHKKQAISEEQKQEMREFLDGLDD